MHQIKVNKIHILLYSLNYSPELTGIGKYNGDMASWLTNEELEVQVLSAKPYYPEWEIHGGYSGLGFKSTNEKGVAVTRCPLYVPSKPTAIKRIVHLVSFAFTSALVLFKKLFSKKERPDVLFVVQPTLFIAPIALLFGKIVGAKTVLHIQDYEVDAMFGLGLANKNSLIARFAYGVETWLMRRFDVVSTISFSMMDKARQKGVSSEKILFFPNWADTNFVTPDVDGSSLRNSWGLLLTDKVVLYAGNMGAKQGLEMVIEAAAEYQNKQNVDTDKIKFVFVGAGAHVDALKQQVKQLQLHNVIFKPLQAWEDVPAMLVMADVHLVVQKKGAADAVLPSKLTNILSAGGNSVVTAEADTELGQISVKYPGIYTLAEPEKIGAFICALDEELNKLDCNNNNHNIIARNYAEKNLNKDAILSKFLDNMHQLTKQ
jgi:colanic acid biosynthesis glycosyl transferase WcaI